MEVTSKGGRSRKTDKITDALIAREIKKFPFKSASIFSRHLIYADLLAYRPAKKPLKSKRN